MRAPNHNSLEQRTVAPPMESDYELEVGSAIEAIQRGEAVRVVSHKEASDDSDPEAVGHVVLPAQMATPEKIARMLAHSDGVAVFVSTRDRLEQLCIAGVPLTEDREPGGEACFAHEKTNGERLPNTDEIALAAKRLAGDDPQLAKTALKGFHIRCSDWGGVVNCPRVYEAAIDLSRLAGLVPAAIVFRVAPNSGTNGTSNGREPRLPIVFIRDLVEYRRARASSMLSQHGPRVRMPTRHGPFSLQAYEDTLTGQLHLALWTGSLEEPVLTRVHSECLTGDVLGSVRCDCGTQLDQALARLVEEGGGVLLYLRQEGRGIGLVNKLRTYAIQDQGFDTVEANERLGFAADLRDYSLAAQMLVDLGIHKINLLTNNPQKVRGLKKHGIQIVERVPLVVEPCSENLAYLNVKRQKLGHWLP